MATGEFPRGYRPGDPLVTFRRIPGSNRYYNARNYADSATGRNFTDYFVRQYRKSRSAEERVVIRQAGQRRTASLARGRGQFQRMFNLKLRAEHRYPTNSDERKAANQEFATQYQKLLDLRYQYNKQALPDSPTRRNLSRLRGPMTEVLVSLGYRTGREDFPVGMSPEGYVKSVMVPFLQQQAAGG